MDPTSTYLLAASQKKQTYDGCFAIRQIISPYLYVYPVNAITGIGVRYTNPSTLPTQPGGVGGNVNVVFSKQKDISLYAGQVPDTAGATYPLPLNVWKWTKSSGFGFKAVGPSVSWGYTVASIATKPINDGSNYQYLVAVSNGKFFSFVSRTIDVDGEGFYNEQTYTTPVSYTPTNTLFSPAGNYLLTSDGASTLRAYPWTDNFNSGGTSRIGTPVSDPGTLRTAMSCDWHPSQLFVVSAGTHNTQAHVTVYNWANGFGTVFSSLSPSTSPAAPGTPVSCRFSQSGRTLFVAGTSSPYIHAYAFSTSTGIGAKFSNPSTLPPLHDIYPHVAVTDTNDLVAISGKSSPYFAIYPWDDTTGFGTKLANPGALPGSICYAIAFY